ncbi:MAG: tetratricopeptide repeat protein, partial [Cyanobacteria bacterium P01_A01_bin.40]
RPGNNIPRLDLDVLTEAKALKLLQSFIGKSGIEAEPELARELCQWLGYLPLGLELVGRYINLDDNLTIEKTLKRLKRKKLDAPALLDPEQADMNAQLGVAAAFDLSWDVLSPEAQELGCYLSLFNSEPFKWSWVETAWIELEDEDEREDAIEHLEDLRNKQFIQRNLLKAVPDSQAYQLHSLIAQYLRAKLEEREQTTELKQNFCRVATEIAQSIPETSTLEEIQAVAISIPHLSNIAKDLTKYVDDDNLISPFVGLGKFYRGQGIYSQAEQWYEKCLNVCRERLGEKHSQVATSLNNLAETYSYQKRYNEAKPLYEKALKLRKQLLSEQDPDIAESLNNLAGLHKSLKEYDQAQDLYQEALTISEKLSEKHPYKFPIFNNVAAFYREIGKYTEAKTFYFNALELSETQEKPLNVATSYNNLAFLYKKEQNYKRAEDYYRKALKIRENKLHKLHPHLATSYNNLGALYFSQKEYEKAEKYHLKALDIRNQLPLEQYLDTANSNYSLAFVYYSQKEYEKAEKYHLKALEIRKQLLGLKHPHVAMSLNNLANLYSKQGRYEDAEPLILQALAVADTVWGKNHPHTRTIKDNLNYVQGQLKNFS